MTASNRQPSNRVLEKVAQNIAQRSKPVRDVYLHQLSEQFNRFNDPSAKSARMQLSCGNFAHGVAACSAQDKKNLQDSKAINLAIVSAYNDMLSAHQPYESYPTILKKAAQEKGATAQFAGGVPAMCDGVTQGQEGMELSLMSRDVIAMATSVALSHQMFEGTLCLGICDKIVPGLLMGALAFSHLPTLFVPAGPMPSGLPNKKKIAVRQAFAEGKADEKALLKAEMGSYHSAGTCTFYGTANSNQIVVEALGLQLIGSSFVATGSLLRDKLTQTACHQLISAVEQRNQALCIGRVVNEFSLVNAMVALLATGGSTNLTIHILAIAKAAGLTVTWEDFAELAKVVPLLARIYPNGELDVNHFHEAGGSSFIFSQLIRSGLMFGDCLTAWNKTLTDSLFIPSLDDQQNLVWQSASNETLNDEVVRPVEQAFQAEGGLKLVTGNLGKGVAKVSAISADKSKLTAPAVVFTEQDQVISAFKKGELDKDCIIVLIGQGPRANGMPELHKLMPTLGALQDRGFKVALLTDGRLSGASGKVPAVIHMVPEAVVGGPIGKICSDDELSIDLVAGHVELHNVDLNSRTVHGDCASLVCAEKTVGRVLFTTSRQQLTPANEGASFLFPPEDST